MKRRLNIVVTAVVCGFVLASCGGGSSKSGLKENKYLGKLPAIYADYDAKKSAHEAKMEEQGNKLMAGGEKNTSKLMKLVKEDEEATKAMKEQLTADLSAEMAKITGNEIPVSYSKALLDSDELFYTVSPVKLLEKDKTIAFAILLSAKQAFDVPRMKGYDYAAYFRFVTSDGSTITQSVLLPVKLENKAFSIAAGEQLLENNFPVYLSNKPELYADFAGIEFISKEEYELLTNK